MRRAARTRRSAAACGGPFSWLRSTFSFMQSTPERRRWIKPVSSVNGPSATKICHWLATGASRAYAFPALARCRSSDRVRMPIPQSHRPLPATDLPVRPTRCTTRAGAVLAACMLAGAALPARAQDIEPRAYSNAPVGVNFLIAGYAYTRGGVAFDASLPITNPDLNTSNAFIAYARVLDLWGMSAKFDATVPYTWLSGTAEYQGQTVQRNVDGLANSAFRLSINLYGAPALTLKEFADWEQDLIIGASLRVVGAVEPIRRQQARQHRHQSMVLQTGGRDFEGYRSMDAGSDRSGNDLHGQQRFLRRQHAFAGPALLAAGTRHLRLSLGDLGFVRRHVLHRRPNDRQWRAEQRSPAELACRGDLGASRWTERTRSSSTSAVACRRAPTTATTWSASRGSTAGEADCDAPARIPQGRARSSHASPNRVSAGLALTRAARRDFAASAAPSPRQAGPCMHASVVGAVFARRSSRRPVSGECA